MFLLLFMAVRFLYQFLFHLTKYFRLRRDTFREKGYRKDQYMRCKVKNSVSFILYFDCIEKNKNFSIFYRVVLFVLMIFIKMKKSLYVHVNMHFINVVYHHGYNKIVHVQCVICVSNRNYPVHVNYLICFR